MTVRESQEKLLRSLKIWGCIITLVVSVAAVGGFYRDVKADSGTVKTLVSKTENHEVRLIKIEEQKKLLEKMQRDLEVIKDAVKRR